MGNTAIDAVFKLRSYRSRDGVWRHETWPEWPALAAAIDQAEIIVPTGLGYIRGATNKLQAGWEQCRSAAINLNSSMALHGPALRETLNPIIEALEAAGEALIVWDGVGQIPAPALTGQARTDCDTWWQMLPIVFEQSVNERYRSVYATNSSKFNPPGPRFNDDVNGRFMPAEFAATLDEPGRSEQGDADDDQPSQPDGGK